MSLQYLADIESSDGPNEGDDIYSLHWLEDGIILGGTAKGHLHAWHATTARYLGKSEQKVHGIGIHSISSSKQNAVVLTASLDGTIALWDTSDIGALLQTTEANAIEENDISSQLPKSGAFPLTLLKAMKFSKKDKADSLSIKENGEGNEAGNAFKSRKLYYAVLHPTEPILMTTGSKAELVIRSYDKDLRQLGAIVSSIPSEDTGTTEKNSQNQETSRSKDFGLCLLVHDSGNIVALGTTEGYVHLFQIEEKKLLVSIKASGQAVKCLHFTPNNDLLVGGNDGNVSVFDIQQYVPKSLSRLEEMEEEDIFEDSLDEFADDFTQSQPSIHTMSSQASSMSSIFSQTQPSRSTSLKPVRSWKSHSRWLTGVKASSDGRIVATSSIDGHVRIWDFKNPTTQALCNIKQEKDIWAIEWKPVPKEESEDGNNLGERPAKRCKTVPISNSAMTAAAQSAKTASMFVTAGADGKVRWYRMAGGNTAN